MYIFFKSALFQIITALLQKDKPYRNDMTPPLNIHN